MPPLQLEILLKFLLPMFLGLMIYGSFQLDPWKRLSMHLTEVPAKRAMPARIAKPFHLAQNSQALLLRLEAVHGNL